MTLKTNGTNGAGIDTVNLILNGGFVNEGSSNGVAATGVLAGTMSVNSSSALGADANEILQINSIVSGTGALQIGGGSVNGVIINQGQSQGLVNFTNANTNYSGVISVGSLSGTSATAASSANAGLQGSNSGATNVLQAFGTGQINLYSAVNSISSTAVTGYTGITSLTLLANGSGSGQTIITGSSSTAENSLNISNSATINLNHFSGSNTGSTFQFKNLSIGGSASTTSLLTLATTSGYGLQIAGTTSVTGPAAIVNFNSVPSGLANLGSITSSYSNAASLTLWQSSTSATTFSSPITDNGVNALSVAFTGGSWTLANSSNSYIGTTGINGGTLNLGVANAVPATSTLSFTGNSVLNMGPYSETLGGLSTTVGTNALGTASVVGTGTLAISNTAGTFQMNVNTSGSTTLNLSQAGAFLANVNLFVVGNDSVTSPAGSALLVLSPSNTIVTPTLYVANGNNNAAGLLASIVLGASNNLNVGNLIVAFDKGSSTAGSSSLISFNGQPAR